MSDNQYIPSTKPGYHWNVYTYKPQGRPGYAVAVEGELDTSSPFQSFTTVIFQDRQIRVDIPGRFTVKNRNQALRGLFDKLAEAKYIDPREYLANVE